MNAKNTLLNNKKLRRAEEDTVDKNPTSTHTVAKNTGSTTNTTLEKDTDERVGEIESNPGQKFWSGCWWGTGMQSMPDKMISVGYQFIGRRVL